VWFVDLAPLVDPRRVPSAVASALGLEICPENLPRGLVAALRDKRLLIVLDNCEHVIDAAAALAVGVLKAVPGAHILATSREPLRVEGERVQRVSSLECPPASAQPGAAEALGFPAVQLFVERAAASAGVFELSDADAPLVAEICRNLDGLPLAIEFAAARVAAFGVSGLADRLGDRLRLLTGGRRTAVARHRTMSATLEWSYGLLTEAGRTVLRRLAIFAGSFTLEAAGAVAADARHSEREIIDQVAELTAKSVVVADLAGAEPRFRLLETTRAYALEKLAESGERDRLVRRHAEYCRGLLAPRRRTRRPRGRDRQPSRRFRRSQGYARVAGPGAAPVQWHSAIDSFDASSPVGAACDSAGSASPSAPMAAQRIHAARTPCRVGIWSEGL
jgi:predicted ATPase